MRPEEAQEALSTIVATERAVQRATVRGTLVPTLVTWGIVWFIGYLASLWLAPRALAVLWLALVAVGLAISVGAHTTYARRVRSPLGRRLGLSWVIGSSYLALWSALLFPRDPLLASFVLVTGIMAAYVLMGLWMVPTLAAVGFAVTAVAVLGFLGGSTVFALLVGLLGGGTLIATGLWLWWRS
ncbi:MAG: hypothetical protein RMH81_07635 [Thermomicrobium sp.]|nr:hypothetical protein [Thermomicrobium sp.]